MYVVRWIGYIERQFYYNSILRVIITGLCLILHRPPQSNNPYNMDGLIGITYSFLPYVKNGCSDRPQSEKPVMTGKKNENSGLDS